MQNPGTACVGRTCGLGVVAAAPGSGELGVVTGVHIAALPLRSR